MSDRSPNVGHFLKCLTCPDTSDIFSNVRHLAIGQRAQQRPDQTNFSILSDFEKCRTGDVCPCRSCFQHALSTIRFLYDGCRGPSCLVETASRYDQHRRARIKTGPTVPKSQDGLRCLTARRTTSKGRRLKRLQPI
jgi:hypothetical protein